MCLVIKSFGELHITDCKIFLNDRNIGITVTDFSKLKKIPKRKYFFRKCVLSKTFLNVLNLIVIVYSFIILSQISGPGKKGFGVCPLNSIIPDTGTCAWRVYLLLIKAEIRALTGNVIFNISLCLICCSFSLKPK